MIPDHGDNPKFPNEVRTVKVTLTGHFKIHQNDLKSAYGADSFEEALENTRRWIKDGLISFEELFDDEIEDVKLEFDNQETQINSIEKLQ